MVISAMLKEIRENNGLSQEQFAEKLAISRQAVSKWERGLAMPDIENLMYISDIFNVSLDTIIKGDIKMADKLILDNKKAKTSNRIFLIGFFAIILLSEVFRSDTQPVWKYGLIVGLVIFIFLIRFLIKKRIDKNGIKNKNSGPIA